VELTHDSRRRALVLVRGVVRLIAIMNIDDEPLRTAADGTCDQPEQPGATALVTVYQDGHHAQCVLAWADAMDVATYLRSEVISR
jgi:hypothetical protein